jgi:hypothetical protein
MPAMRAAIAIAVSQAAGFRAMQGSLCTPLMPPQAAQTGLRAPPGAQARSTSSAAAPEGRDGYLSVLSEQPDFDPPVGRLGGRFEILPNTRKPCPCGIAINPIIDACMEPRRAHAPDLDRKRVRIDPVDRVFECQRGRGLWFGIGIVEPARGIETTTDVAPGPIRSSEFDTTWALPKSSSATEKAIIVAWLRTSPSPPSRAARPSGLDIATVRGSSSEPSFRSRFPRRGHLQCDRRVGELDRTDRDTILVGEIPQAVNARIGSGDDQHWRRSALATTSTGDDQHWRRPALATTSTEPHSGSIPRSFCAMPVDHHVAGSVQQAVRLDDAHRAGLRPRPLRQQQRQQCQTWPFQADMLLSQIYIMTGDTEAVAAPQRGP